MKKKLALFSVIAIVSMATFTYYNLKPYTLQYNMIAANVEALAATEDTSSMLSCWSSVSSAGNGNLTHVTYCGDCQATLCRGWSGANGCWQ